MAKIQNSGNQYTITIPNDVVKRMGWGKGTEVYIGKDPDRNLVFIEKVPSEILEKSEEE